ncbi:hypothetical protein [Sinomonas atrocyanea]|uniref:hypothetical protein n=1 Tax=Sinomonas atrocyanea TaxID=37927 RepID=UPI0027872B7C|nr:hypothetical protein [Sinomonas atrocyanea]MDQ0261926.1 hypothetical protein [Sinomonas atrocyanea]MDR6623690.1 hypothetical protein [Sinomonas atrocyanea]
MTTTVPVLSGLTPTMVALDGTVVRAWADPAAQDGAVRPVLAHRDLLGLVVATPALRVLFLDDGAILFGPFGMIEPLGWVHVERVGLKCYDLREAGLPFALVGEAAVQLPTAA